MTEPSTKKSLEIQTVSGPQHRETTHKPYNFLHQAISNCLGRRSSPLALEPILRANKPVYWDLLEFHK